MGSLVVQQCRGWARVIASLVFILATPEAGASYINIIHAGLDSEFAAIEGEVSSGFALSGTAWNPGPGTSRVGGSPAPGGATWSVLP